MPNWKKLIVSGSDAILKSLQVANGVTGSLLGTASWASNATTASYITGSSFTTTNPALSASYALTASYALNGGGSGTPPGGNQYDVQVNDGASGFTGNEYFKYKYQDQKIVISNNTDPISTPLDHNNYYTTERFNNVNSIVVDSTTYQFTNAQFPYSKYITSNTTDVIISIGTNAGTSAGPGLMVHSFKCDYSLVNLSSGDVLVDFTRTGTLYCVWDEDNATYTNPIVTDTAITSVGGLTAKLQDIIFTAAWNGSNIELSIDTTPGSGVTNVVFNGLFTIFSMRT